MKLLFRLGICTLMLGQAGCANRILSHDIDGTCLVNQQDMTLSKEMSNYFGTRYRLYTPDSKRIFISILTIRNEELGIIPKGTKFHIHRVYEQYNEAGFFEPAILLGVDEGVFRGVTTIIPSKSIGIATWDNAAKRTITLYTPWFGYDRLNTIDIQGKHFSRVNVNTVEYNEDYLKRCD